MYIGIGDNFGDNQYDIDENCISMHVDVGDEYDLKILEKFKCDLLVFSKKHLAAAHKAYIDRGAR